MSHTCDATCAHTYYQCNDCGQNVRASKHPREMCDLMRENARLRGAVDVTLLARARSVLINMRSPMTAPTQETVNYTIVELGKAITTIQDVTGAPQ